MSFDIEILHAAHKHSIYNTDEVKQSVLCGCFYCMKLLSQLKL